MRTDRSPLAIQTDLSEDIYRTETYQAHYTEPVAYQDEEVYYEQVAYQEEESYIDQEEYWQRETVCKDETRYEEVCKNERKCEPRFERRCERKRICQLVLPGPLQALMAIYSVAEARADRGNGDDDQERQRREREQREKQEREKQERERRENEERQRRDNEQREKQERERRENEQRENRERQEREKQERERRENEQREKREREEREKQQREKQEREKQEREKREREEREKHQREEREKQEREKHEREEREKREREERERKEREEREKQERCWKEVCENVKVGEDCKDERKCERVPKRERICKEENVKKTRPVGKTRWVTKYREERKTRWVTKYRDEDRCCVTKEREVFDHTIKAHAELQFPAAATLVAGEKETFSANLNEVSGHPQLTVNPRTTLYTYRPQVQQISADNYVVKMDVIPTHNAADLGESAVSNMILESLGTKLRLSFTDKGVVKKAQIDYMIHLLDPNNGTELLALPVQNQKQVNATFDLNLNIPVGQVVLVRLEVLRNGIVISAPVAFTMDRRITVVPDTVYDIRPYMDKALVGKFSLEGRNAGLVIYFRDLTKDIPQVKSEYQYKLSIGGRVLAEKTFQRSDLTPDADGKLPLSAARDFSLGEADLRQLSSGKTISLEGNVIRRGSRFPNGEAVIPKAVNLEIE